MLKRYILSLAILVVALLVTPQVLADGQMWGNDVLVHLDCTPETGHKRLGGFGTDWYFDTKKGWCHESETEVQ